jgi:hypothetical protein
MRRAKARSICGMASSQIRPLVLTGRFDRFIGNVALAQKIAELVHAVDTVTFSAAGHKDEAGVLRFGSPGESEGCEGLVVHLQPMRPMR